MAPERLTDLGRGEFLARDAGAVAGVGVTGLAGLRAVTGAPALSGAKGRDIVLEAREVNWELAPGKRIRAMAYTLHGQSFRVLSVNGARLAAPVVKDTVDVHAHMGSAEMEFTAHNPGDWLFHCHKPMHMDGGIDRPRQGRRMTPASTVDRVARRRIASRQPRTYSFGMGLAVRRVSLQTGALAVILLALTALACVASFAHAGMVMMPGQDCSGPGCEQIACARSDQTTALSRQLADPLVATAVAAAISVSPPPRQTTPVAPTVDPPSRRPLSPLAPRSPPAA